VQMPMVEVAGFDPRVIPGGASERRGYNSKWCKDLDLQNRVKLRPESGLVCLGCAEFARQRIADDPGWAWLM